LVDFADDGRPIGIEITSPSTFNPDQVDRLLDKLGIRRVGREELMPLTAA
jgi:hypothetical protein